MPICQQCGNTRGVKRTKQKTPRMLCWDCRIEMERELKQKRGVYEYHRKRLAPIVFERDGYKCLHCGTTENLTLDHIIGLIDGGTDDLENLQTLCQRCNSSKGNKH